MSVKIEESWAQVLGEEFEKPYFKSLIGFVKEAYQSSVCFPPGSLIFNAFNRCKWDDVQVVIIGQDPDHGPRQANGLSFSVNNGVTFPPSLLNIFKELNEDLGIPIPVSGDLSRWADQGVLLLNATLTVEQGKAGSHQKKGWEVFTDAVIRKISEEKSEVVFMLWGKYAQDKGKVIDTTKHFVLKAKHPSPLSANFGGWFGTRHFSQANTYLKARGKNPIEW
jgi:uracil-DNA glycosylase